MTWRIASAALAVLLAATLVPAVRHLLETPPPPPAAVRLVLPAPAGAEFGSSGTTVFDMAVAPSGRELVFAAATGGQVQLWRRALDTGTTEPIPGTAGGSTPAFSPDGESIWFFADGLLRELRRDSGTVRDAAPAPGAGGIAVRADGTVLFAPAAAVPLKRLAGGQVSDATTLREGERVHGYPSWLGAGDEFIYLVERIDGRRTIRLRTGDDDVELTPTDSHAVLAGGYLLRVRDGVLAAERFDPDARRVSGTPRTLTANVAVSGDGRGAFAVGGPLLVSSRATRREHVLQWFTIDGQPRAAIAEPGDYWQVRLAPDERTAAVTMLDPLLRTLDIFTLPVEGGPALRLSLAVAADTDPVWSADGRRIAFRSTEQGHPEIYAREVGRRSADPQPLWESPLDEVPTDWTRGHLLFHARSADTAFDIWMMPAGAAEPTAVARSGFNETSARISPDGRLVAYTSDESGHRDVYVSLLRQPDRRVRISTAGGDKPQWIRGGSALVFRRGAEIVRVDLAPDGDLVRAGVPVPLAALPSARDFTVTRDGSRLLAIVPASPAQDHAMDVVVNWVTLVQ